MRPHEHQVMVIFLSINISALIKTNIHYSQFILFIYHWYSSYIYSFIQKAKGCVRSLFSFSSQMPELLKEMLKEIILLKAVNS